MIIKHEIFITKRFVKSLDILVTWVAVICCWISFTVYDIEYKI